MWKCAVFHNGGIVIVGFRKRKSGGRSRRRASSYSRPGSCPATAQSCSRWREGFRRSVLRHFHHYALRRVQRTLDLSDLVFRLLIFASDDRNSPKTVISNRRVGRIQASPLKTVALIAGWATRTTWEGELSCSMLGWGLVQTDKRSSGCQKEAQIPKKLKTTKGSSSRYRRSSTYKKSETRQKGVRTQKGLKRLKEVRTGKKSEDPKEANPTKEGSAGCQKSLYRQKGSASQQKEVRTCQLKGNGKSAALQTFFIIRHDPIKDKYKYRSF